MVTHAIRVVMVTHATSVASVRLLMPLAMFCFCSKVLVFNIAYIEEVNNLLYCSTRKGCPELIVYTVSLSKAQSKREEKKRKKREQTVV